MQSQNIYKSIWNENNNERNGNKFNWKRKVLKKLEKEKNLKKTERQGKERHSKDDLELVYFALFSTLHVDINAFPAQSWRKEKFEEKCCYMGNKSHLSTLFTFFMFKSHPPKIKNFTIFIFKPHSKKIKNFSILHYHNIKCSNWIPPS